jgi:hypothetical protein
VDDVGSDSEPSDDEVDEQSLRTFFARRRPESKKKRKKRKRKGNKGDAPDSREQVARPSAKISRVELIPPGRAQSKRSQRRLPGIVGPAFTQTMRTDTSGLKLLRSSLSAPSHTDARGQEILGHRIEAIAKAARALSAERSQGFAGFMLAKNDTAWSTLLVPETDSPLKVEEVVPSPKESSPSPVLRLPKVSKAPRSAETRLPSLGQQSPSGGFLPPPGWRKGARNSQLASHGRTIMS